jgi:uncharacterized membrane protein YgcG
MISFIQYLNEKLEPLPGRFRKDKGYVDYKEINGHKVHVRYRRGKGGSYRPTVHVNGSVFKQKNFSTEDSRAILNHVKKSFRSFLTKVKPNEVIMTGTTKKHATGYQMVAKSKMARDKGFEAEDTRRGAVMRNPTNQHVGSGVPVKRDPINPAHEKGGKFDKDWKFWKYKGSWKGDFKSAKINAKGAFKGGGGDFGGGGGGGSW